MHNKKISPKHNDGELQRPVWPLALIVLGLALTLAWLSIVGYGLIKLVEYAK